MNYSSYTGKKEKLYIIKEGVMKKNEFTQCPICGGKLEQHTVLQHPIKGIIHNIPHDICTQCGEIFLGD